MTNLLTDLTVAQLKRAVAIKEQIDTLERELSSLLGRRNAPRTSNGRVGGRRKRRKMSAASRAKIAAAQRARWAKAKAGKGK